MPKYNFTFDIANNKDFFISVTAEGLTEFNAAYNAKQSLIDSGIDEDDIISWNCNGEVIKYLFLWYLKSDGSAISEEVEALYESGAKVAGKRAILERTDYNIMDFYTENLQPI